MRSFIYTALYHDFRILLLTALLVHSIFNFILCLSLCLSLFLPLSLLPPLSFFSLFVCLSVALFFSLYLFYFFPLSLFLSLCLSPSIYLLLRCGVCFNYCEVWPFRQSEFCPVRYGNGSSERAMTVN